MPLLTEDHALLRRFRAGDHDALDKVYRHYSRMVVKFLRAGFSFEGGGAQQGFAGFARPSDLEGIVQQVFLQAFSEASRLAYDGVRPYGAYLLAIARNEAISQFRRARSSPEVLATSSSSAVTAAAKDPSSLEAELEHREVNRLIDAFRATTTDAEKRLFHLRFEEELSQNEASRAMNLSRIQLRRMEAKLKRRLLELLKAAGYLERIERSHLGNIRLGGS